MARDKTEKPNVLLILNDDMDFSDIECYGGEVNTPIHVLGNQSCLVRDIYEPRFLRSTA